MQRIAVITLFIIVTLTWSTTWLAMQIAVTTIPPLFATGMRFLFAAPFLIIIAKISKTPLLFPKGQRMFQATITLFYFSVPFTLMIYGEKFVSSGLASVIFSFMPVAVMLTSLLILKTRTNAVQIAGLIIATVSLALILISESESDINSSWQGVTALIVAVIMHAILYTKCKQRSCTVSVITFNALPCLAAGVLLLTLGSLLETPLVSSFSLSSVWATFYLGSFAGVFGILCYFGLQKKAGAFSASLVFLIFPVVAVILEEIIYGHGFSQCSLLLMLPLAAGILLTLISGKKMQNETTPQPTE
ncbi:DMT family transporter [Pantoea ananatis]|uniref:DMT family transporter n=1 Tax=Pantoea ananas TaxID=553 RepID=UPI001B30BF89|nr:DMT family transporter [Pantoea ananatis]